MAADKSTFHADFRLSITQALGDQLAHALTRLGRAPLNQEFLKDVDQRPGVYQLYLDDTFVYVGKADRSLRDRLEDHRKKLSGRENFDLEKTTFLCLYVEEDFSALAPEQLLINRHKGMGEIPWNNNGFGNNDPGKQRDETVLKASHFDNLYPINLNLEIEGLTAGTYTLSALFKIVKKNLPYTFRFEQPPSSKVTKIQVSPGETTPDHVFRLVSGALPPNWQITALKGYVIMYANAPKEYQSAWRYYRAGERIDATPCIEADSSVESPEKTLPFLD